MRSTKKQPLLNRQLLTAVRESDEDKIAALLTRGANVEARNNNGETALMGAAIYACDATINTLLKANANTEARNNNGETALILAAQCGRNSAIKTLLKAGANMETRDNEGATALMWAAIYVYDATLKTLLKAGANMEARDNGGATALMWAARCGCNSTVKTLLKAGANVEAKDKQGKTAQMWAAEEKKNDIVEIIQEHKIKIEIAKNLSRLYVFLKQSPNNPATSRDVVVGNITATAIMLQHMCQESGYAISGIDAMGHAQLLKRANNQSLAKILRAVKTGEALKPLASVNPGGASARPAI